MLNKLNEVGLDNCPSFVAKSMNQLPMTTPDAFNMAKVSKDIASVMKIEDKIITSFYALSCLQKDFKYVMDKCASILRMRLRMTIRIPKCSPLMKSKCLQRSLTLIRHFVCMPLQRTQIHY